MAWHQISVITNENTAPKLADFFDSLGAVSVTYMDAKDEPVYEPAIGETKIWTNTQVVALYERDIDIERVKALVEKKFRNYELRDWQIELIEDQEWERAWMEYYHPMKFAHKLWVCPTGQEQYISFPSSGLGMPTFKLCLMFNFINMRINLFYLLTHQAELGYRHSQTGVWERDTNTIMKTQ